MMILSHRGLDPDKKEYFLESSKESFLDQTKRGYNLEFDLQPTKDGNFVIFHDSNLNRISGGVDDRKFLEMNIDDILKIEINKCHFIDLGELLKIVSEEKKVAAIHVKSSVQTPLLLDILVDFLKNKDLRNIIIFDLKLESAKYLKSRISGLLIAASVAHPYDIKRYNKYVGGTLVSVDDLIENRNFYDWAWLDEWDRSNENGSAKTLYNSDLFVKLRSVGFKIAVVSPELHSISPGLLGGESHPDAANREVLMDRINKITKLRPDAICTDYPDLVRLLV